MEPLLLEALRFGVAVLAGGLVAVISSVLAFRYARRLQLEEAERRDATLRHALFAEIRENLRRLGGPVVTQVAAAPIVRVAWDAARGIKLDDHVFDVVAIAYMHGAELERYAAFILARIEQGGVTWAWTPEHKARQEVVAIALQRAQVAYDAFAKALKVLEPSFPRPAPKPSDENSKHPT